MPRARAKSDANEAASAASRAAKEILTPGGAAMRNRCPGADRPAVGGQRRRHPVLVGGGHPQLNPDRPLAVIP